MGCICASASAPTPTPQVLPYEPPLVTTPASLPSAELEQKSIQMMNLQIAAFDLAQQGKRLSDSLQQDSKKVTQLLLSAQTKVSALKQRRLSDYSTVMAEAAEVRLALEGLCRTAYARHEDAALEFTQKLSSAEDQAEGLLEYVASAGTVRNLAKSQAYQVNELELSGSKVVNLLEQARAACTEMQQAQEEVRKGLKEVPELLQEVEDLEEEPESKTTVVEELEMIYVDPEETAVAAEMPEEQTLIPAVHLRDSLGVEFRSPLAQLYTANFQPSLLPFDPPAVLHTFDQLLTAWDPLEPEVMQTVDLVFRREFPEDPERAIVQFVEGLRLWVEAKLPYSAWVGDMVGVFTTRPLAFPVLRQVLALNKALEPEIVRGWKDVEARLQTLHTGGAIPLTGLLSLLSPVFHSFPQYSAKLWDWLKPPRVADADYLRFLVVHHMQVTGLDTVALFKQMTTASRLSTEDLRNGLTVRLQLALSDAAFNRLELIMKNPDAKVIRRIDFLKFLNLETYVLHKESEIFRVPRYQVLSAFTEICRLRRLELAAQFRLQLPNKVTPEAVEKALRAMGESRDLSQVMKAKIESFEEALTVVEHGGVALGAYFCKHQTGPEPRPQVSAYVMD